MTTRKEKGILYYGLMGIKLLRQRKIGNCGTSGGC